MNKNGKMKNFLYTYDLLIFLINVFFVRDNKTVVLKHGTNLCRKSTFLKILGESSYRFFKSHISC